MIDCFRNSKSFMGMYFFLKLKIFFFQRKSLFFSVHVRSLNLFQLSVGYVCFLFA